MTQRSRGWCITIFDEDHAFCSAFFHKDVYFIAGHETCPTTGKKHWQCYLHVPNAINFNTIKKHWPTAHIEKAKGSPQQNITYCSKEDKNPYEWGVQPKAGERSDLDELKNELLENKKKVDDIVVSDPHMYHQYGRTLHKIEDLVMRKKYRTEMTKGIWYFGETGVGKSHRAFENYTPETHYVWKKKEWQDDYTQQDIVIINEFRGWIEYDELLTLVDKWPHSLPRRNRENIPFTSKLVIVTSSLKPEEIYYKRNERDGIAQLYRRFEVYECRHDGTTQRWSPGNTVLGTKNEEPIPVDGPTWLGIK